MEFDRRGGGGRSGRSIGPSPLRPLRVLDTCDASSLPICLIGYSPIPSVSGSSPALRASGTRGTNAEIDAEIELDISSNKVFETCGQMYKLHDIVEKKSPLGHMLGMKEAGRRS